jgi:predicted amidohydrolase YtcJ
VRHHTSLLLANGRIWTGERFVSSVTIEGNRIVAVDAPASHGPVLDLGGRLAVPGFIDNHTHFIRGGLELSRVKLRDAATAGELAARLASHSRTLKPGEWITGGAWDEQRWPARQLPDRALIDAATPDHPVFVGRSDMHMALANSVALRRAGITRDTPDPAGGTIVRDAGGEPNGLLKDTAMALVSAVIPPPSLDERVAAARAGLAEAARSGVTSFCDMGMSTEAFDDLRAYARLDRQRALTARVNLYTPIRDYERLKSVGIEKQFGSTKLRIGGLKGFSDGSLGSSTAAFYDAFADDSCNCGLVMEEMENGAMARWVADADAHELQIALHAIGDRANDQVLSLFESFPNVRERRFRVEHAQHLNDDLIARFGRSGVIASMQPHHAIDDGQWAERKIGAARARTTYAFRSLLDAGAIVTFGSDWTVAPLNPLAGIYAAVTRRTLDGRHPDGWIPEQKITVAEALRCYTINNAYALFAEHELGRIEPGFLADLTVLSDDIFTIAPENILDVQVDMTIVDGEIVFRREL